MKTVKTAESEVKKLTDAKQKLETELAELSRQIQTGSGKAKKSILSDLLGGTKNSGSAIEQAAMLKIEHEAKSEALPEIDQAIREAEMDLLLAKAGEKRQEAKQLRDKAAKHKIRTDELLKELQEHEGCNYIPFKPAMPTPNTVFEGSISWKIPQSQALINQAERLEREADQLEAKANKQLQKAG